MQLKKDKIISIEYIGEDETADIEIIDAEGEHQQNYFLGNGINVHNSGAMNNYPAYKFGKAKAAKFEHEIIKKWTDDTYGLIIYQEQVMQIVRELGDFDWAQTNTVRKVMSKSGGAEYFMKTFWPTWKESCMKKGITEKDALKAFHRIMSFGSWAFNKSHSVAYAMVSYICMWLKTHYPIEYVTAYLNYVTDTDGSKTKDMIKEVSRLGISIKEADVNISGTKFVIDGDRIVAGLTDIKHVGLKAVEEIKKAQPFKNLMDFLERVNSRACNKRTVENLIRAGAFDSFGYNKKALLDNLERIHLLVKKKNDKSKEEAHRLLKECLGKEGLTEQEIAQMKSDVSPITVGKHITEFYGDVVSKLGSHIQVIKLKDIELDEGEQQKSRENLKRRTIWVVGLLTKVDLKRLSQEVKEIITQEKEQRYALTNIVDGEDFIVASFRGKIYERYEQKLFGWKNKVLLLKGNINIGFKKLYVEEVYEMDRVREYLLANYKPYKFTFNYLFQHPISFYFRKVGGIEEIRKKYKAKPLKCVLGEESNRGLWSIVIVKGIIPFTIRKEGPNKGKKFFRVIVEDETYTGSFMVYNNDMDYKQRMKDLIEVHNNREAVLLRVQRDMKFDPEKNNVMSLAVHKFEPWRKLFIRKFPMKSKR